MNATAIYSKSGKGVQEASGKTSLLKRGDRAVLSAIDGRATLAEVAQKVGKAFDKEFEGLIAQLDKDGFIREVSPGAGAAPKPGAAAPRPAAGKPAAKPTAPMDEASDLDFSSLAVPSKPASKPAAAPPAKAAAPVAQQSALNKAREEAEARAAAEKEKQKAEAEAKVRAELEAKMRAEAEAKAKEAASDKGRAEAAARLQAEADAKIKAAREAAVKAAAEAKAKADAEAKRVREEAERAKREAEELKQRLEAERKAREEVERKAKEEAERVRREAEEKARRIAEEERRKLEEERRKMEDERRRREEEERKKEEERAERRRREEEEEQARKAQREEEERKAEEERAARRKQREEEEKREEEESQIRRQQAEERRRKEEAEAEAEAQAAQAAQAAKKAQAKPAKTGDAFADSLMSDLDSFTKTDEEDAKQKKETERKAKEEAKRREKEEEERREREEEEERERKKKAKDEAKRKEKEEEERREREEAEEKERKKKEKEEAKRREKEEEEEKERKKKEEKEEKAKAKAKKGGDDDIPITDDDLRTDDVKRDQRQLAKAAKASPKPKEPPRVAPPPVSGPSVRRKPKSWGKPVALALFALLVAGVGVVHVMPVSTADYERAASEAIGQPVRLGAGRVWLFEGNLQVRFDNVAVGDGVKIASVRGYPTIGALSDAKKVFSRIDLVGLTLPQSALGDALFTKARGDNFSVERVVVRQMNLPGPLTLPKDMEADLLFDSTGGLRSGTVRGPDTLLAKLAPRDQGVEFDVSAGGFTLPIVPELTLSSFGMKGTATRQGMQVEKWDGTLLNGNIAGTANVRWGEHWRAEGVFTMRGINAAVFSPALLSEGRGEGTAKFNLSGPDPAKLGIGGRYEATFTVNKGVLGSVDLSNALRTGGRQASGRTPFNEMTGQATYNAGAISLRNINITAGTAGNLNAAASADITENGALTGRIVADVRAGGQTLRTTINLGGTAKEPQVRN